MNYEQIKDTAPCGYKRRRTVYPLKAWHVLLFFVFDMLLFLSVGSYVQYHLGMAGVAITELWMLGFSLLFVWLMGGQFKKTFPVRKPRPLALAGTVVFWLGGYFSMLICNLILLILFPDSMFNNAVSFDYLVDMVPLPVAFLIIAILPAICEEAMHRGVIQTGISSSVQNRWLVVLIMGTIFGIFHVSPIKFPATAILGMMMSWLLISTNNMLYSSFFHFFHNAIQVLVLMSASGMAGIHLFGASVYPDYMQQLTMQILPFSLGIYIAIFGTAVPILLYTGHWMIQRAEAPVKPSFLPKGRKRITLCKLLIPMAVILVIGIIIACFGFSLLLSSYTGVK